MTTAKFYKAVSTEKGFENEVLSDSRNLTAPKFNPETRTFYRPEPMTKSQFEEYVNNNFWQSFVLVER